MLGPVEVLTDGFQVVTFKPRGLTLSTDADDLVDAPIEEMAQELIKGVIRIATGRTDGLVIKACVGNHAKMKNGTRKALTAC